MTNLLLGQLFILLVIVAERVIIYSDSINLLYLMLTRQLMKSCTIKMVYGN